MPDWEFNTATLWILGIAFFGGYSYSVLYRMACVSVTEAAKPAFEGNAGVDLSLTLEALIFFPLVNRRHNQWDQHFPYLSSTVSIDLYIKTLQHILIMSYI